jgi:hypothetical protein
MASRIAVSRSTLRQPCHLGDTSHGWDQPDAWPCDRLRMELNLPPYTAGGLPQVTPRTSGTEACRDPPEGDKYEDP